MQIIVITILLAGKKNQYAHKQSANLCNKNQTGRQNENQYAKYKMQTIVIKFLLAGKILTGRQNKTRIDTTQNANLCNKNQAGRQNKNQYAHKQKQTIDTTREEYFARVLDNKYIAWQILTL